MKYNKIFTALALGSLMLTTACVDADLDDALEHDKAYENVEDADKHILGVYSQFMDLTEQMVVLNELRGDLMTITGNANTYFQQVDAKVLDDNNPYLDPTPYYTVIKECNDCLHNLDIMMANHDLEEDEYNERYSDIAALRCYVYLQLAAQFGTVPYVTEPIYSVEDMLSAQVEYLSIDELLPRLIAVMESLPFMEPYEESLLVNNPESGTVTLNGEQLKFYFVHKKLLLADLYLWNAQYYEAATLYKEVMSKDADKEDTANSLYYRCNSVETVSSRGSTDNYYQSYFLRYFGPDDNSFGSTWPDMFADALSARDAMYEWIWAITFPSGTQPAYPFVNLFAPETEGGSYQLKPSARCANNYLRTDNLRTNGAPFDPRMYGTISRHESETYVVDSINPVCGKYLGLYNVNEPEKHTGRWWGYRSALIHLRFAECMNRLGYPDFAWTFINRGIAGGWGSSYPSADANGRATDRTSNMLDYKTVNGGHTIFHLQYPISMGVCNTEADSALLYFDSRFYTTNAANIYDGYARRGPWRYSNGIRRGRAVMNPQTKSDFSAKTLADCTTKEDSIYLVEKIIMDEAALEMAHEGHRFPDLVRVSRRMNRSNTVTVNNVTYTLTNDGMDGNQYFQSVMAQKAAGSQNVLGQPDYSGGEASWFLPYR